VIVGYLFWPTSAGRVCLREKSFEWVKPSGEPKKLRGVFIVGKTGDPTGNVSKAR